VVEPTNSEITTPGKIVALMKSQGVTRAFWEKDEV
jgi:hypothetical protein